LEKEMSGGTLGLFRGELAELGEALIGGEFVRLRKEGRETYTAVLAIGHHCLALARLLKGLDYLASGDVSSSDFLTHAAEVVEELKAAVESLKELE
jgi:hypothetical protein